MSAGQNTSDAAIRRNELTPLQKAALAIKELRAKLDAAEGAQREPLAIVGMDCRFPQADCPEAYWRLLAEGRDAIGEVPKARWDLERFFDPNPNAPGKINTRYGGFIDGVDGFDAAFFGISRIEAESMDPQQRLLLEVAWHALEDAGLAPSSLRGSRTGVFVGMTQNDYGVMQLGGAVDAIEAYTGTGNGQCFAAGRIAYVFGFHGPTFTVDTACSSSMVALHQACQALRNRECDTALVAGTQLNLTPPMQIFLSKTQSFSPDGRCRTFDDAANGFVLGEGIGVIVLRRLSDALQRRDPIRAVIRATGVNHDGPASGLTVPSEAAQESLIRWVYERARLTPGDIDYVEAHGTATQLGDPIEVGALRSVFGVRPPEAQPLLLGSVKTNFGHLNAAAGMAGLIKVVLMMEHEQVAPNLHFRQPSSRILWDGFSVRVPTALTPWRRSERMRRGAVNSFGLSGTNTHTVLEEAPQIVEAAPATPSRPWHLFCLSARNETALRSLALAYLDAPSIRAEDVAARDICFSANGGRNHFAVRLAFRVDSNRALRAGLERFLADGCHSATVPRGGSGRLALVLGTDAPVAAVLELAPAQPRIAATLARCEAAHGGGLLALRSDDPALIFACQLALADFWLGCGVRPSALVGNGSGLLTALCLAASLTPEQAFQVLAGQAVDGGAPRFAVHSGAAAAPLPFAPLAGFRLPAASGAGTAAALRALQESGCKTLLAIGAPQASADELAALAAAGCELTGLPADTADGAALWAALLDTLANVYRRGLNVEWAALVAGELPQRVRLPKYPFQHERYWLERETSAHSVPAGAPAAALAPQPASIAPVVRNPGLAGDPGWSQLLGGQLEAVATAITEVVAQQLGFLRGQMAAAAPVALATPALVAEAAPVPAAGPAPCERQTPAVTAAERRPALPVLGESALLLLAAADEAALAAAAERVTGAERLPESVVGAGPVRAMLVHGGREDAAAALGQGQGWAQRDQQRVIGATARAGRSLVFMFPGVGDHYLRMAEGLYRHEPVFRASFDHCCDFLLSSQNLDLRAVLYPPQAAPVAASAPAAGKKLDLRAMLGRATAPADPAETLLNQTVNSQPLVFIVEYALGRMWLARGIVPQAMIGYSIGEYAAACLAGVVGVEDALTLIVRRAQMIQGLPHGVMLAVPWPEARVRPLLGDDLSLSIVSTPSLCVLGGPEAAIVRMEECLRAEEVVSRRLPGTHAFHSRLLEPLHAPLVEMIRGFRLQAPKIPYLSNLTGDWITATQATDPTYWARHTWQTVRFADGLGRLLDTEGRVFLEAGPGQSLGSFVLQHPAAAKLREKVVLPSLRNRYEKQADEAFFLATVGKLWLAGVDFELSS